MYSRKLTKVVIGAAVLAGALAATHSSRATAGEPLAVQPAVYQNLIDARPAIGTNDGVSVEQVRWRRGYRGYGYGWGGGYRPYRYSGFYRPYGYGYGGFVAPGYAYPAYASPAYAYPSYGPAYGYGGCW